MHETLRRLKDRLYRAAADPVPAASGFGPWRQLALAGAGFCAAGVFLLHPQLGSMYSLPDLGDPLFSIWRMGWIYRQILGDPRPLFDATIFQMTHWMPLGLVALHRFADTQRLRPAMVAALCGVAQLYSSMYYGVFFLVYGLSG